MTTRELTVTIRVVVVLAFIAAAIGLEMGKEWGATQ